MPIGIRTVDRFIDQSDVQGPFSIGQVPAWNGAKFAALTPVTIPLQSTTSGIAQSLVRFDHTIDNSSYPSVNASPPVYYPWMVNTSYLVDTANVSNQYSLTYAGILTRVQYGSTTVNARGTVHTLTSLLDIDGVATTSAESEPCNFMGLQRVGTSTKAPKCRSWFADFSLQGPIGQAPNLLDGMSMFVGNYFNGSPFFTPSGCFWAITYPGKGAGGELGHFTAQSYPVDVGFGIVGKSGTVGSPIGVGFRRAIQIGGDGSGWYQAGTGSNIAIGVDLTDISDAGLVLHDPLTTGAHGIRFGRVNENAARTWQWFLHSGHGLGGNAPGTGFILAPGVNDSRGQILWGADGAAPSLFRPADNTLQVNGLFRVQRSGTNDPLVFVGDPTSSSAAPSIKLANSAAELAMVLAGGADNFFTGALAGDVGLRFNAGAKLMLGPGGPNTYATLINGKLGLGTQVPSDTLHITGGAGRFAGAAVGTAAGSGVYLGIETGIPELVLANGTAGQNWFVQQAAGTFQVGIPGTVHFSLNTTVATFPSKTLNVTGAGTSTFTNNVSVGGNGTVTGSLTVGAATGLLKRTAGLLGTAVAGTDYEPPLGNPTTNGFLLASTTAGVRSWVAPGTTASSSIDHNLTQNLAVGDVHTQYFYWQGRARGQAVVGGTEAGDDLTLASTIHATRGGIYFGSSVYRENLQRLGIGTYAPQYPLHVIGDAGLDGLFITGLPPTAVLTRGLLNLGAAGFGTENGGFAGGLGGTLLAVNQTAAVRDAGGDVLHVQTDGTSAWRLKQNGRIGYGVDPAEAIDLQDGNVRLRGTGRLMVPLNAGTVGAVISRIPVTLEGGTIGWIEVKADTGGGGGGGTTNPTDNFQRTNRTSLNNDQASGGATWHEEVGTFGINTNLGYSVTRPGTVNYCYLSNQAANGTITVTFPTIADGFGVGFRANATTDALHFIWYSSSNGNWRASYWNGSVLTTYKTFTGTPANGDTLAITLAAGSPQLSVSINGGAAQTSSDASLANDASSILHGLAALANANTGNARVSAYSFA